MFSAGMHVHDSSEEKGFPGPIGFQPSTNAVRRQILTVGKLEREHTRSLEYEP